MTAAIVRVILLMPPEGRSALALEPTLRLGTGQLGGDRAAARPTERRRCAWSTGALRRDRCGPRPANPEGGGGRGLAERVEERRRDAVVVRDRLAAPGERVERPAEATVGRGRRPVRMETAIGRRTRTGCVPAPLGDVRRVRRGERSRGPNGARAALSVH